MIRAVPLLILTVVGFAILAWVVRGARAAAARRPGRRDSRRTGGYEFDRRRDQARRRLRRIGGPAELRDEIVDFLESHHGVEAYVEPKTVISPMSVVVVDADGEWRRFELAEDRYLRQLASERGLPIFDASRTGYPPRMRKRPPAAG
jgi:hypothetical protein